MRRLTSVVLVAVLAVLMAGCSGLFSSQGTATVRGVVTVEGSAPGSDVVEIRAVGTKYVAEADPETGVYELKLPAPGEYTLQAGGGGISVMEVPVVVKRDQILTDVNFELTYAPLPATPVLLTFEDPEHRLLLEIPYENWNFEVVNDPFGDPALYFPLGSDEQRPPDTYNNIRYALLKYEAVDDFEIEWDTLGDPNANHGNRSQAAIFGWQDMQNWYFVYLADTKSTRVARIANGNQTDVCKPGISDVWWDDKAKYQNVRVTVTTEGTNKVVRTYANGEEVEALRCNIPLSEYTPGKVGFGALSASEKQAMYFRNVLLDIK